MRLGVLPIRMHEMTLELMFNMKIIGLMLGKPIS